MRLAIIVMDKIKAFFKCPKPEAKAAEKKATEPPKIKVAEAPEKKVDESRRTGFAGNQD